ncbi:CARDB domain-containing protein [Candidatus Altiarchaeota archaeon]
MMKPERKGQAGVELIVSFGFILLIFIIIGLLATRTIQDSTQLKIYTDAKRVTDSFSDNINTISEQGSGYYRFFNLPQVLYGLENYTLSVSKNIVEITWGNQYAWARPVINSNVTVHCLDYGRNYTNRVLNDDGRLIITCHRPDLLPVNTSINANPGQGGIINNVSIDVLNSGHIDAEKDFTVMFTNLDRVDGTCAGNHPCTGVVVNGLPADKSKIVSYLTPVWGAGTYRIQVEVDYLDEVLESIEEDNNFNFTLQLV